MASYKHRKKERIRFKAPLCGMLIDLAASVVLILLLTLFIYLGWLPETSANAANTVIKLLAAAAAGVTVGLHRNKAAWWYGGIAAAAAQLVLWALMSLYLGAWNVSWSLLADLLMSFAVGGAVAAVLLRRRQSA